MQAEEALKKLDQITIGRTPKDRHLSRMKALYVDVNDAGAGWNRPCEFSVRQSIDCLTHAANEEERLYYAAKIFERSTV